MLLKRVLIINDIILERIRINKDNYEDISLAYGCYECIHHGRCTNTIANKCSTIHSKYLNITLIPENYKYININFRIEHAS